MTFPRRQKNRDNLLYELFGFFARCIYTSINVTQRETFEPLIFHHDQSFGCCAGFRCDRVTRNHACDFPNS